MKQTLQRLVETGKRERLLESVIKMKLEESVKSLHLEKMLEKIEQQLTQVAKDRIQVSVNEALQKVERNHENLA